MIQSTVNPAWNFLLVAIFSDRKQRRQRKPISLFRECFFHFFQHKFVLKGHHPYNQSLGQVSGPSQDLKITTLVVVILPTWPMAGGF